MNAKVQLIALIAFSLIGCAHSAATHPAPLNEAPSPELATELFYQQAVIKHDLMKIDGWNGNVAAVASEVAKGWHDRGVYTDRQQESRNGTRVSFSAHKQDGAQRYRVIVQELSREQGIVMVLYAAWPSDLDDAFSKQFEIEVDEIVRSVVIRLQAPKRNVPGTISI